MKNDNSRYPNIFLLPAVTVYVMLFIIPTILALYYSFTDWTSYTNEIKFVGIQQFVNIFSKSGFFIALRNTIVFALIVTIFQNFIAVIIAIIVNNDFKTKNYLRTIFFMPCVLSMMIVGLSFSAILHPNGPLNQLLTSIGLEALTRNWMMDSAINIYVLAGINVWMFIGFSMAIYLAGLQSIPKELYEAAMIDGANWKQNIRNITLPLLAPSFTINIVMTIIGSLKVFELIYVTTGGGPGDASQVIMTTIFKDFGLGLYGSATASSLILFVLVFLFSIPILFSLKRKEIEL